MSKPEFPSARGNTKAAVPPLKHAAAQGVMPKRSLKANPTLETASTEPPNSNGTMLPGRSPLRSRIALSQESGLFLAKEQEQQTRLGASDAKNRNGSIKKTTETAVSEASPNTRSGESARATALRDTGLYRKPVNSPQNTKSASGAAKDGALSDAAAFDEAKDTAHHPYGQSHKNAPSSSPAVTGLSTTPATASAGRGGSLSKSRGDDLPQGQTSRVPPRRFSGRNEEDRDRNGDPSPSTPRGLRVPQGEKSVGEAKQHDALDSRAAGDAKRPGTRPLATRAGYALDPNTIAGDAVTTDTRDSVSRGRRSAQVLRGLLGSGERGQPGTPGQHPRGNGALHAGGSASRANPLHHRGSSVTSMSESDALGGTLSHSSFGHEADGSNAENTPARVTVRAGGFEGYESEAEQSTDADFDDEQSFPNQHGELEWLRAPALFYLFANIIKWNELRQQRRALLAAWETNQTRGSQASASLISIWTQHRERELRALEAQISFSVFELEGIYLNRLLMRWSKPKLRVLLADVASTWKKEGPYSAKFDGVSSRLFDAISSEVACQISRTCLFSLRQWLGRAEHYWVVASVFVICFVVSILCIVFLAVFGRTREAVCIALSAVLGVAVIVMYGLAMIILHHNTYASAAASYFRGAAVRAAQRKLEEGEMMEEDGLYSVESYRGDGDAKYGGADSGNRGGDAMDDDSAEENSEYTEDQVSLAVRNLRALTEGNVHPPTPGAPYYRVPRNSSSSKHETSTGAGGYYDDDLTFADDNIPSLTSRPLQAGDQAMQQQELDRDNTLLLSSLTYEQHQEHMKQRQSLLVQETMSSPKPSRAKTQGGAAGRDVAGARTEDVGASALGRAQQLQQLADLPDKVNITALVYCNNASVLAEVAPQLWERMFMVLRVGDLHALDNAFKHGSERFKVIIIHALDAPEGSDILRTALMWLQVERRPVFFVSRAPETCSPAVPVASRLRVPFSSTALNTLLLAGIGVEAELASVSFPALLQQSQSPSQPFQVPAYILGKRLGGGAFGNVFEAEMEETGAKCAVKRMYLKEDSDEEGQEEHGYNSNAASTAGPVDGTGNAAAGGESPGGSSKTGATAKASNADGGTSAVGSQLREIAQEVEIMSSLQHPGIVRYYFCERDDNCISIFMELCTGGSLSSLIHGRKLVNPPEIKLLLREIISAVAYLHNLRIVHRDLKPDNVLFRQGHAKITDFGTAVHKHGGDLRLIKGTFAYMAPETLVGEPYGSACDVWSIGCIAAEVLSVDLPQHALGLPAMCEYYRTMGADSSLPIQCDVPGVRDFLLSCLQRNPNARSTAAELFYHPILQARDTSIHTWMVKVVERRRHRRILQHKMSHRIGPGGRGSGAGAGGTHAGGNLHRSSSEAGADGGDGYDLHSGNNSVASLDSSQLEGRADARDSQLTP